MKLATVNYQGRPRIAKVVNEHELVLCSDFEQTLEAYIAEPNEAGFVERVDVSQVQMMAPIRCPNKLICIGKNYADHAREMGGEAPELPVVFSKFSSALIGPGVPVELPAISKQVDYEAELVVVIGRGGKNIARDQAMDCVFGVTCGNDISARDWQKGRPGGQWLLGKTFDTFAPLGPWVVTLDEVGDPHDLDIEFRLNDQIMQQSNTRHFLFPIDELISHLSQFVRLVPGDLIFTGTPAGVGAGRKPPVFLKDGDRLDVRISGIGQLSNPVIASNRHD